jgi:hypothetical protein
MLVILLNNSFELILLNRERGIAMLLIEQNTQRALKLASRAYLCSNLDVSYWKEREPTVVSSGAPRGLSWPERSQVGCLVMNAAAKSAQVAWIRYGKGSIAMKATSGLLAATALVMSVSSSIHRLVMFEPIAL